MISEASDPPTKHSGSTPRDLQPGLADVAGMEYSSGQEEAPRRIDVVEFCDGDNDRALTTRLRDIRRLVQVFNLLEGLKVFGRSLIDRRVDQ